MFAKRVQNLLPSPIIALDTKAKTLKQKGIPVVNLTAGEPDFETPEYIKNAATEALKAGFTKYTSSQGIPELRKAVVDKFKKDNKIIYDSSQIIIGAGAKQLLYSVFQVLCDHGDEVIIPVPAYGTFAEQVKLAEGKPVLVKLKPPFKLKASDVEKHLTKRTKIVLLNSPSNPTGAIIDLTELKEIADLVVKRNLWVVSDEIYEKFNYTGKHVSIASLNKKIRARTVTINGVSKTYSMTGWRLGYAGGPKEVINVMTSLQSQSIGNVTSFVQKAAILAIKENQISVNKMREEFLKRREFLIEEFSNIKDLSFSTPEGAFYFFVSIEKLLGKKYKTAVEWCSELLERERIAVVPGEAFSCPGYFRFSFTSPMKDLKVAIEKIKKFI